MLLLIHDAKNEEQKKASKQSRQQAKPSGLPRGEKKICRVQLP
jgi:hypothetical protein